MRSLVIFFFFFILIFGFGIIAISGELPEPNNGENHQPMLGQISIPSNSTATNNGSRSNSGKNAGMTYEVDRDDDPTEILPCTDADYDCSLRSAIVKANEDGNSSQITFAGHRWIILANRLPDVSDANTTFVAKDDQEVHVDGNNLSAHVFRITGPQTIINGLRIYGAGAGFSNIVITESAYDVTIKNNIIGDGDSPPGHCGSSENTYAGIYVDAQGYNGDSARAWIFGNTIECINGSPGEGIVVFTDKVIIGLDNQWKSGDHAVNVIQFNRGFGVNLNRTTGNTITGNKILNNQAGTIFSSNVDNNIMFNDFD